MKLFTTFLFVSILGVAFAQDTINFENLGIPVDSFENGSSGHGGFDIQGVFFPNDYNVDFGIWGGWALSSKRDTASAGFMNQYSAMAGKGADSSDNFAVSFGQRNIIQGSNADNGEVIFEGFSVCNGTYPFLSMRDGDAFAKKFGGATGDDPDFFLMTIKKYSNGVLSTDSVDFYLADFRFEDNSLDYIVKDWTYVDLSILGVADSLQFTLSSSDVGSFGMNTPAYFCLDNLIVSGTQTTSSGELEELVGTEVFPNPTSDFLHVTNEAARSLDILVYDMLGRIVARRKTNATVEKIDLRGMNEGVYAVSISDGLRRTNRMISLR